MSTASGFAGVWTAIITPFKPTGELDLAAFREILKDQAASGVRGVIVSGTTGESPTTTIDEKKELLKIALEVLGPTRVMAGTGSYNTAETIALSRYAADQGVAGLLVVTPYYNRPTQAGLEAHFAAIADQVSCPIMLYNVPGRTGTSLTAETVARLARHPRIRAIKEASGSVNMISELADALTTAGQAMDILTGDDVMFLPSLAVGAIGLVSVASNLLPRAMVAVQTTFQGGRTAEAQRLHRELYPLIRDLFIESNPSPIKAAMSAASWCAPTVRLPLVSMSDAGMRKLGQSLQAAGIGPGRRPR